MRSWSALSPAWRLAMKVLTFMGGMGGSGDDASRTSAARCCPGDHPAGFGIGTGSSGTGPRTISLIS